MIEWKEYKLGEICKVKGGKRLPKGNNLTTVPNTHPYIRVRDMGEKYLPINNLEYVPNEVFPSIKNYIVDKGDLLLSIVGTVGLVSLVNDELDKASLTENCVKIIPQKDIVDNEFLYYFLKSNIGQEEIFRKIVGAVQPKLPIYNINDIGLNIPDLPTQTAIAEILSSLDDKIELNNKINQELENLAQTLFKQWFIDFEFPNENGEPYKSSGGEMVESELGEIPKGWEIVKVQDLEHKLQTGTRPKGGVGGITQGVPSIGAESIKKLGYYDFSKVKFVTEEFAAKMKRGKVEGYELLIYKDGGKPGTFIPHFSMFGEGFPFDSFFINEHVFLLDFFNKHFNSFCYFYFDSEYVKPVFENNGGKAAIPGINQEDVKNLWVFNPNLEAVKLFGEFAHSSVSTILKNCKENIQLTNLRDSLLPKLISGELEVSQTQTTA